MIHLLAILLIRSQKVNLLEKHKKTVTTLCFLLSDLMTMKDDDSETSASKHGFIVIKSVKTKKVTHFALKDNFSDAAMRIKSNSLGLYLIVPSGLLTGNGFVLTGGLNLEDPTLPVFEKVKDLNNNPRFCPTQIEFMPNQEKVAVLSSCPSDDQLIA
jgi:hypothetical protein